MNEIEIGTSVTAGSFSGFVAHLFESHGETYAKVVNFAETNHTTAPVAFLDVIS